MKTNNIPVIISILSLVIVVILGISIIGGNQANKNTSATEGILSSSLGALPSEALLAQIAQDSTEPPSILAFTARQFGPTFFYSPFVAMGPAPITEASISVNGNLKTVKLQLIPYVYSATGYPIGTAGVFQIKALS